MALLPIVEDYCMTMLSTVIAYHRVTDDNIYEQYSYLDLVEQLRKSAFGSKPEWRIQYPDAVHQGLHRFKNALIVSLGVELIDRRYKHQLGTNPFMELPSKSRALVIKLKTTSNFPEYGDSDELLFRERVLEIRLNLFRLHYNERRSFRSIIIEVSFEMMLKSLDTAETLQPINHIPQCFDLLERELLIWVPKC